MKIYIQTDIQYTNGYLMFQVRDRIKILYAGIKFPGQCNALNKR